MVRVDLAYQNLPITVIGMGAGLVYSTLGALINLLRTFQLHLAFQI